jgi:NhaP-type Na+/H+ or K+/H+ antiporter
MLYFLKVVISSIIIGYLFGYITAFTLSKISGKVKDIHKFEIGIMMILPWVSYLIAQVKENKLNKYNKIYFIS